MQMLIWAPLKSGEHAFIAQNNQPDAAKVYTHKHTLTHTATTTIIIVISTPAARSVGRSVVRANRDTAHDAGLCAPAADGFSAFQFARCFSGSRTCVVRCLRSVLDRVRVRSTRRSSLPLAVIVADRHVRARVWRSVGGVVSCRKQSFTIINSRIIASLWVCVCSQCGSACFVSIAAVVQS